VLKKLIACGLDVNAQESVSGRAAMHILVMQGKGDYETTNELELFLIDNGARLDIPCHAGRYPLHYAFIDDNDNTE